MPRMAIEQMRQLCNDIHSQLKGIASFLSHFSSSVTASQLLSRTTWTASRVCPALPFKLSVVADVSARSRRASPLVRG
jgi:hypothetical protein